MKNLVKMATVAGMALVSTSAMAATSAALITSINGASGAPAAFTEIQPGTTIKLGSTGEMKFVHYQKCNEVQVLGGNLTVNMGNYKLNGGKVVSETPQPCPHQVRMATSTTVAGGLLMRGVSKSIEISDRPSLVIVGSHAADVSKVGLYDKDRLIAEMPVTNNQVVWGASSPGLTPGADYRLSIIDQGKQVKEMMVRVVDSNKVGVVIVRVE
ncbi:MAG: hypothetical protein ORO03_11795 [Alphaproteobacteria bacterium]|nr:hypothetical protein [Alphaproteobacteria bacterium]